MGGVVVEQGTSLELFPATEGEVQRVAESVSATLRAAGGSWRLAVQPSAALVGCWILQLRLDGHEAGARRVMLDERMPQPAEELQRAIVEMLAESRAAARAGRELGRRAGHQPRQEP